MAFKRSGVRLPLAPPAFAPYGGYGWQASLRETWRFKGKEGAKAAAPKLEERRRTGSASQPSRTQHFKGKEKAKAVAPKLEERRRTGPPMTYVYILHSEASSEHFYVGLNDDLRA